jgi:SSS family solute:Na+ symporter
MVTAATQLLAAATLLAKNPCRPLLAPGMTDRQVGRLARMMVFVLTVTALFLAIHSSLSLVSLLLPGFAGVGQLFPGVVLGLFSKRVTTSGIFAGLATGISIAVYLMVHGRDPYKGFNAGFIALCFNLAVTGVTSLLTRVRVAGSNEKPPMLASSGLASE